MSYIPFKEISESKEGSLSRKFVKYRPLLVLLATIQSRTLSVC
jgi:hypothetical protein